jgi:hypothetical protein
VDSTAPFGRHGLTTARERYFAPVWIRSAVFATCRPEPRRNLHGVPRGGPCVQRYFIDWRSTVAEREDIGSGHRESIMAWVVYEKPLPANLGTTDV